jgi:NDP-sugar pyrophosphorylase family protein
MENKEYFGKEEEFLNHIFKNENKFLSKTKIEGVLNLNPELLLEKNFILEYCDIKTYEDKFSFTDGIFRNKSDIFIYLSKRTNTEMNYQTMIYFEPQKLEETKFFIKNLLKLK